MKVNCTLLIFIVFFLGACCKCRYYCPLLIAYMSRLRVVGLAVLCIYKHKSHEKWAMPNAEGPMNEGCRAHKKCIFLLL